MDDKTTSKNGQPSKLPPGSFFQAPTAPVAAILAEPGEAVVKVFCYLCFTANYTTHECSPTVGMIAKACDLGERAVKKATSRLKRIGAIAIKSGRPNTYWILYGAPQCPLGEESEGTPVPLSSGRGTVVPHRKHEKGTPVHHEEGQRCTPVHHEVHHGAPSSIEELNTNKQQQEQSADSQDHVQNFRDDVKNLPIESRPTCFSRALPKELLQKAKDFMAILDDVLSSNRNPGVYAIAKAAAIDANASSAAEYALNEIEEQNPLKSHRIGRFISTYRKRLNQLWEEEQV